MTAEIVTKRRWFWTWQDQDEEAWLAEMSRKGLHLQSVGYVGMYRFVRGEPTDYAYRLDFQSSTKEELGNYVQLFEDAGWEHVGQLGAWHYFRAPIVEGEAPEIFTDVGLLDVSKHLFQNVFFGREVMIQGACGHTDLGSDLPHGNFRISFAAEQVKTLSQKLPAVLLVIYDFRHGCFLKRLWQPP